MRYKAAIDSEPNLVAFLDVAQDEPVFIERGQKEVAVIVSAREYARLNSAANLDFQEFCDSVSDKAAVQGLTESKLNELLNNA
jgi:PHD/YefM family antitoxin component YafN of YafNO toxin-antitoxin module